MWKYQAIYVASGKQYRSIDFTKGSNTIFRVKKKQTQIKQK